VGLAFLDDERACRDFRAGEDMLCERFLSGREYSVGILEGQALPPIEIRPRGGVYDYHHKYTAGATEEICPAPLAPAALRALEQMALAAFRALGMRDFGRIDFREDGRGRVCFLEANTLPGLAATSLLPLAAGQAGLGFGALCERIALLAAKRKI
jgi:D-alanine-D-alanine ligase